MYAPPKPRPKKPKPLSPPPAPAPAAPEPVVPEPAAPEPVAPSQRQPLGTTCVGAGAGGTGAGGAGAGGAGAGGAGAGGTGADGDGPVMGRAGRQESASAALSRVRARGGGRQESWRRSFRVRAVLCLGGGWEPEELWLRVYLVAFRAWCMFAHAGSGRRPASVGPVALRKQAMRSICVAVFPRSCMYSAGWGWVTPTGVG